MAVLCKDCAEVVSNSNMISWGWGKWSDYRDIPWCDMARCRVYAKRVKSFQSGHTTYRGGLCRHHNRRGKCKFFREKTELR